METNCYTVFFKEGGYCNIYCSEFSIEKGSDSLDEQMYFIHDGLIIVNIPTRYIAKVRDRKGDKLV